MKTSLLTLLITVVIINSGTAQNYISKTIPHDGIIREYSIYIPSSYDGTESFPLLFNFHGGNDVIGNWRTLADMRPIADTSDFILIYPQARPDPSDGNSLNWLPKTQGTFDDVPFVSNLIDEIANDYQIDQNRIYACGYSLGGEFSYELACKLNNRIAAIGAVARTMQANPSSYCTPIHDTGVLTILGTDDSISPYNGLTWGEIEYYTSAADTHNYWAEYNNCDPSASVNTISASVERHTWSTTLGCTYVEELKIIGGGHDWPGSFGNMTIDASEEIWQFVSGYDLNGLIDCASTSTNKNNIATGSYKVYPNPFHQELTIEIKSTQNKKYKVYNMIGELVKSGILNSHINMIDLSSLVPNVYILNIENNSTRITKME